MVKVSKTNGGRTVEVTSASSEAKSAKIPKAIAPLSMALMMMVIFSRTGHTEIVATEGIKQLMIRKADSIKFMVVSTRCWVK